MKLHLVAPLQNADWPVLILDAAACVCQANAAAVRLFALQDNRPTPLSTIWSAANAATPEQFLDSWQRQPSPTAGLSFSASGGKTLSFIVSICALMDGGELFFVLQLLPANSDLPGGPLGEQSEKMLAHKQKLECALQLARTVALDFNNALTTILGHTSLMLGKMPADDPWRASLLEVEKSASKAAEIASDLGTFSQQDKEGSRLAGNLNQLLQRTVDFFKQNTSVDRIQWQLVLERSLRTARFDEAKMQQAFIKLLDNAVQAMPERGSIIIQTRNVELTGPSQDRAVQLAAGTYVCAEFSDTGRGIPAELLPRIFEPFFTTKGGAHRGLGLAWVYGIVTNHGGGVAVSSEPGRGTSVRVYLPAEARLVRDDTDFYQDLTGNQTVLIVDDEEMLLTMGRAILSSYGYQVLTANTGEKALQLLAEIRDVALVITDMVMPGMSGRELIEQIRSRSPEQKVLCTSGYVRGAARFQQEGFYLQKPFTAEELLLKVKETLAC